jgi:hypothetical protein
MLRTMVCAAVALVLVGGVSLAEKKDEKSKVAHGKILKCDTDKGILCVMVKKSKDDDGTKIEFKITKNTKFTAIKGADDKEEYTGLEGLKAKEFKKNTPVRVHYTEEDDVKTATRVETGGGKKVKEKE